MAEKNVSRASSETEPSPTGKSASGASTDVNETASHDEVAQSSEHAQSSEQIEAEIEQTREELGDTVAALAEKTDVKRQAQQKVEETKKAAQEKASATSEAAKQKLEAAPEATDRIVAALREDPIAALRENPVPAFAAVGALLVVASIIRRRRR